jgi:hypothetical protein
LSPIFSLDDLGQTHAVVGIVLDQAGLLRLELVDELDECRALDRVVAQAPEERLPAVGGEIGVRRRRCDVDEAVVLEDAAGGLGLTGEGEADDADDVVVLRRLRHRAGGLRGIPLGVDLLERDLAVGIGLVVFVDGGLRTVVDVDAELSIRPGHRAEVGDRQLRIALRVALPRRFDDVG